MSADESVTRTLRARARALLGKAIDTLGDPRQPLSERVHDLRTSIKKVRSLVSLVRSSSAGTTHRANRRLRRLAASTSALRDAQVALDTMDVLSPPRTGNTKRVASVAALRGGLAARLRAAERTFEAETQLDTLIAGLLRERGRVRAWVPPRGGKWDKLWRGPCVGVSKSYRRARRTMRRAYDEESTESFHDWRKAVKAHRYQLQFLQLVWPRDIATDLAELEQLGELLGLEHDLTVLTEALTLDMAVVHGSRATPIDLTTSTVPLVAEERMHILTLIEQRRRTLREEARPLGERLFNQRARLFRHRLQDSLHARGTLRAVYRVRADAHSAGLGHRVSSHGHGHPSERYDLEGVLEGLVGNHYPDAR